MPFSELFTNPKLVVSFIFAALLYGAIGGLLYTWWDSYSVLGAVTGIACGWIAGILLAPYESESKKFKGYSKAVGAFITGFLVAKFDRLFELLIDKDKGSQVFDPIIERRFWVSIACLLVTTVVVFVARTYWQALEEEEEED